ncbi:MAG: SYNERG-CTERM sorting domain-containing protein, partial [Synergistaceae bacterium]|nr:SYNERG-CTERM sorting domain-containing protein [Synergistaceae bacterium]
KTGVAATDLVNSSADGIENWTTRVKAGSTAGTYSFEIVIPIKEVSADIKLLGDASVVTDPNLNLSARIGSLPSRAGARGVEYGDLCIVATGVSTVSDAKIKSVSYRKGAVQFEQVVDVALTATDYENETGGGSGGGGGCDAGFGVFALAAAAAVVLRKKD